MLSYLSSIGFDYFAIVLIFFCCLGSAIGSFAHAISLTIDPCKPPNNTNDLKFAPKDIQRLRSAWLTLRVVYGAIFGLIVALYFIGFIHSNITSLCKISALSIFIGYSAPDLWRIQEKLLIEKIKKLNE